MSKSCASLRPIFFFLYFCLFFLKKITFKLLNDLFMHLDHSLGVIGYDAEVTQLNTIDYSAEQPDPLARES